MKFCQDRTAAIAGIKKWSFVPYNVIGILENRTNESNPFYLSESGKAIWIENNYFNYVAGEPSPIMTHFKSQSDGFYGFSGVEGEIAACLFKEGLLYWHEKTERYHYVGEGFEWAYPYDVVDVPMEEAIGINDRYEFKGDGSLERIQDAIQNRPTAAIYLNDEIASYVLLHEDDSIGYMYTKPQYRKLGLGYCVTKSIVGKMRDLGKTVFLEINKGNTASQQLAAKSHFVKDAYTPWFGMIKGIPEYFKTWKPYDGRPCFFTTIAQLRIVDKVISPFSVKWTQNDAGTRFKFEVQKDNGCEFEASFDENYDVFRVENTSEGLTAAEVLTVLGEHFPDKNASFVVLYEMGLETQIKGLVLSL